jgi:hypothetical protein
VPTTISGTTANRNIKPSANVNLRELTINSQQRVKSLSQLGLSKEIVEAVTQLFPDIKQPSLIQVIRILCNTLY